MMCPNCSFEGKEKGRNMKIKYSLLICAVVCTFILSISLSAQGFNSVTGKIVDSQGAIVSGASVTLYSENSNTRYTAVSDSEGRYNLGQLSPGKYVIEFSANGFSRKSRSVFVPKGERCAPVNITLDASGPDELIVVTASGTPQTVDQISKAIDVITGDEIEKRDEISLSEALRSTPGVRVQQQGGPGSLTKILFRGLRSSDTSILIDGQRFRDPSSTQGDSYSFVGELFNVNIDRLEVCRGSGSSLYGTNAIGGLINIITNQGGGDPVHGDILLEGGSLGIFRSRGKFAGGGLDSRLAYSAGVAHLNVADGVNGNEPTRNWSGQGFARYSITPGISVSGRLFGNSAFLQLTNNPFGIGTYQTKEVDAIPGKTFTPNRGDGNDRRDSSFLSSAFTYDHRINAIAGYRVSYQRLDSKRDYSYGPGGGGYDNLFNKYDGSIDILNTQGDLSLGKSSTVTFGYEFERENYSAHEIDNNPFGGEAKTKINQHSNTFFVQDQIQALNRKLFISAAFRTQSFDLTPPQFIGGPTEYTGKTFSAPQTAYTGDGSIAYFVRSTGTKFRTHIGNGYKAPSLYERFGAYLFFPLGDPNLRPERSISVDGGIDQSFVNDKVRISATYFYTRLQEVIEYGTVRPGDPFGRFGGYLNTGGGIARGVELSTNIRSLRFANVKTSYTYTNSINNKPSSVPGFLPAFFQPRHMYTLTVDRQIIRNLEAIFDVAAYGSYYFPLYDSNFFARAYKFKGPIKADLGIAYTRHIGERSVVFKAKVDNLFNKEYYENGFRAPGATVLGGISYRF